MGPALADRSLSPSRIGTVRGMSKPLGPYTPAVRAGDFIIVSGQVGRTDAGLAEGGVAGQTAQAIANLRDRLAEMGAELTDVVKTTCFLIDMDAFTTFNEAYVSGFGAHRPARSTVAVRELPGGAQVEIEALAYRPR